MTIQELKNATAKEVRRWINSLPSDGDFCEPELVTDIFNEEGHVGDYSLVVIFHNRSEAKR